mgnify:CR=1 FL=1
MISLVPTRNIIKAPTTVKYHKPVSTIRRTGIEFVVNTYRNSLTNQTLQIVAI